MASCKGLITVTLFTILIFVLKPKFPDFAPNNKPPLPHFQGSPILSPKSVQSLIFEQPHLRDFGLQSVDLETVACWTGELAEQTVKRDTRAWSRLLKQSRSVNWRTFLCDYHEVKWYHFIRIFIACRDWCSQSEKWKAVAYLTIPHRLKVMVQFPAVIIWGRLFEGWITLS